jgi:hypothetical protein
MKMRVHLTTPPVIRRTVSAIAATAVAFAMLSNAALAAPPVVRDHIANSGAGATNTVCEGNICTSTSVLVIVNSPDGPSQACLDISRYAKTDTGFVGLGYETGCAPLTEGAFSIDAKGLANATLSNLDVVLQAFTCDTNVCQPTTTRTATVRATWTGVGDLNTFRSNSKSTFGGCSMYFVGKGSQRQATATLTVDGRSLDAAGYLAVSTQKIKVLCR